MIGYQTPTGEVYVLTTSNELMKVNMVRKQALREYLKKKNISDPNIERLIGDFKKGGKSSGNTSVSRNSPDPSKRGESKKLLPKQIPISDIASSYDHVFGQRVKMTNGGVYKKGRKFYNLVSRWT